MRPAPVTLDYAGPSTDPHRRARRVLRWLLALCGTVAVAALGLILFEVESVLITGPLLFLLACGALVPALRTGDVAAAVVCLCHAAICLSFVALVNLRNWSPDEAFAPFAIMGGVYVLVGLPVWAWRVRRLGRPTSPGARPDR